MCHKWKESAVSCGHGLCHNECTGLRGCSQVVWHRPPSLPERSLDAYEQKKMCTIKGVCMQPCLRAKDVCCEVLWVFSGYADCFLKVCDIPIYIYTLFYCTQWGFSDKRLFVKSC